MFGFVGDNVMLYQKLNMIDQILESNSHAESNLFICFYCGMNAFVNNACLFKKNITRVPKGIWVYKITSRVFCSFLSLKVSSRKIHDEECINGKQGCHIR